jgi:hypothetical protein
MAGVGAALVSATLATQVLLPATRAAAQDADLDQALEKVAAENQALAKSQEKIEKLSSETSDLLDQYRNVERRIEALQVYNGQLGTLLASQQTELDSLRDQIDNITVVGRQITPMMLRMIESLDKFIELDVPFLQKERRKRVQDLRKLMDRADVADSEKFRRLMEAYQIENEYGRTIEAYRGEVEVDGKKRTVDFLRVGRIILIYQTLDQKEAGRWDLHAKKWMPLTREEKLSLPSAMRIARKQEAPNLIRLPVNGPEEAK